MSRQELCVLVVSASLAWAGTAAARAEPDPPPTAAASARTPSPADREIAAVEAALRRNPARVDLHVQLASAFMNKEIGRAHV